MFYYYGAKHRLSSRYPEPAHNVIVEPFAGAAGYAMRWLPQRPKLRAVLVEKDPRVVACWKRLLDMAPQEILDIDEPALGEWTTDFLAMTASASNAVGTLRRMRFTRRAQGEFQRMLRRMARCREEVGSRVRVILGSYEDAPDIEATWLIDPPYQPLRVVGNTPRRGGRGYAKGCNSDSLNYKTLADFCRSRKGQVIVCEYAGKSWMNFKAVHDHQDSSGKKYAEGIWHRP